ncbi:hypothetical protein ECZU24_00070 [Escherichia coli]|nr:hypothetical protein ECZU24_00070 [Escherichia coli]
MERGTGVKTDWRGYAVVPYATEYRRNNISLDPMSMSMHTELDATTMEVIPSKGALVRAEFNAHVGIRGLFNVHYRNKPVPFGATVSVPTEGTTQITGIVGDSGQVYLRFAFTRHNKYTVGRKFLSAMSGKLSITGK